MTANRELRVEVFDDEIIVTLSSSRYSVTYFKPEKLIRANRQADRRKRRSARGHERVLVSRQGVETRKRQGEGARVDCVASASVDAAANGAFVDLSRPSATRSICH
jgi:hypothetical protein